MYLIRYLWDHVLKFWKCKHPAFWLAVQEDSTEELVDVDFTRVTLHLYCQKCQEKVDIKYSKCNGGVEAFLERGRDNIWNK